MLKSDNLALERREFPSVLPVRDQLWLQSIFNFSFNTEARNPMLRTFFWGKMVFGIPVAVQLLKSTKKVNFSLFIHLFIIYLFFAYLLTLQHRLPRTSSRKPHSKGEDATLREVLPY